MSMVERRMFRIGVVVLAVTALELSLLVTMPPEMGVLARVVGLVPGALGIGLLFRSRVARAVAGLGFALGAVGMPISLVGELLESAPQVGWDRLSALAIADAIATTALGVWLCVRAIQALLGRTWAPSLVTARLVGAALAAVAAYHLQLASAVGAGLGLSDAGAIAISATARGAQIAGFPGWPIWHLGLAAIALAMLVAPRRTVRRAATWLLAWFGALFVLATVEMLLLREALLGPFIALMLVVPVYLAWWLRDELRRGEPMIEPAAEPVAA